MESQETAGDVKDSEYKPTNRRREIYQVQETKDSHRLKCQAWTSRDQSLTGQKGRSHERLIWRYTREA